MVAIIMSAELHDRLLCCYALCLIP